jgi:hypothetical protein
MDDSLGLSPSVQNLAVLRTLSLKSARKKKGGKRKKVIFSFHFNNKDNVSRNVVIINHHMITVKVQQKTNN